MSLLLALTAGGGGTTYTLTAQAGSYAISGQAATITRSRLITAQAGAYTYTGQSATITRSRLITAQAGAYTYTGQSATITRSRYIAAQAGAYTYTGQDATITYIPSATVYTLTALPGAYSYTGQSAAITVIPATSGDTHDPGSYVPQFKREKPWRDERKEKLRKDLQVALGFLKEDDAPESKQIVQEVTEKYAKVDARPQQEREFIIDYELILVNLGLVQRIIELYDLRKKRNSLALLLLLGV